MDCLGQRKPIANLTLLTPGSNWVLPRWRCFLSVDDIKSRLSNLRLFHTSGARHGVGEKTVVCRGGNSSSGLQPGRGDGLETPPVFFLRCLSDFVEVSTTERHGGVTATGVDWVLTEFKSVQLVPVERNTEVEDGRKETRSTFEFTGRFLLRNSKWRERKSKINRLSNSNRDRQVRKLRTDGAGLHPNAR